MTLRGIPPLDNEEKCLQNIPESLKVINSDSLATL